MLAAILELEAGPGDEVLRCRADENVARVTERHDAGTHVHGDAARLLARTALDLARVHAGTHREPERAESVLDRLRAADRARRPVEDREDPVPGGIDLLAGEAVELASHRLVVRR